MNTYTIKYLNAFLIFALMSFPFTDGKSQCTHDWDPVTYTNSTTAFGIVTINGVAAVLGDSVAAFVGGECRAIGAVVVPSGGIAYVTLLINGDLPGELINFEIWDESECSYMDVDFTASTDPGNSIGFPPNFLPLAGIGCPTPLAGFTSTITNLTVSFQNTSTNASDYLWDFGDGVGTSTLQHPSYTYTTPGSYNVCLTASDIVCGDNEYCEQITIVATGDDVTFTLSEVFGLKDSIVLCDITVTNFTNVTSFDFSIGIDTSVYEFATSSSADIYDSFSGFSSNFMSTSLGVIWTAPNVEGVTLSDGSLLFSLKLKLKGEECDSAPIVFSDNPISREVIKNGTTIANFVSVDGQITIFKTITLTGKIKDPLGALVNNVEITLKGDAEDIQTTALDGVVQYPNLISGGTYELCPSKVGNIRNGVNIQDASFIIQHLFGINPFTTPEQFLAGDVFTTASVLSGADVFQIQQMVLENIDTFPNGKSYVFYPLGYVFDDPANPYPFENSIMFNNLTVDTTGELVAVKVGDVNQTADPTQLVNTPLSDIGIGIAIDTVAPGDIISIPVIVCQGGEVLGWQWTNSFNPQVLELIEIESINTDLMPQCDANNFGKDSSNIADGDLTFAWTSPNAQPIFVEEGTILFTLKFRVIGDDESFSPIAVTSNLTPVFAFDNSNDEVALLDKGGIIEVRLSINNHEPDRAKLDINTFPNPFRDNISIKLSSPINTMAELTFHDIQLRKVKKTKVDLHQGENIISWDGKNDAGVKLPSGIYTGTLTIDGVPTSFKVSIAQTNN